MNLAQRVLFCLSVLSLGACGSGGSTSDAGLDGPAPCPTGGMGTLNVTVTGLPMSAGTPVTVNGGGTTRMVGATGPLTLPGGTYDITAAKVITPDPIVRTVYSATISQANVCVGSAAAQTVTVTYAQIPTSNKLWLTNGNAMAELVGYASANLAATGTPAASVTVKGPGGKDVAFDKDGNLWSFGPTTAEAMINRIPASAFASSGTKMADRAINLKGVGCVPPTSRMAFDAAGNLWVSSPCQKSVVRISAADLAASGDVTPSVTLSNIDGVEGIAFDKGGNLWVGANDLRRYDAAHLSASAATPDLTIHSEVMTAVGLTANGALFDKDGNLWSYDFGGNAFFKITPSEQMGTGMKTVVVSIRITIGVTALLEGAAFDEGGGLWITGSQGKFARLAPSQLGTSSGAGNPTVPQTIITSADIGSAAGMAFYPAPAGVPLYDAL